MKRAATLGFLLFLTACFGLEKVEQLRHSSAAQSSFHRQLADLYLAFVDKELDKYDWDSAGYFASKGLAAANGETIEPENPDQWSIPAYAQAELRSARASIVQKLSPSFVTQQPGVAAALLFNYDCWVEEQEEAWEERAIEKCKRQVMRHLEETDQPIAMGGPLSTSYLFHFPEGQTTLEGLALQELGLIAASLAESGSGEELVINGHADQPGSAALSMARADFIRSYMRGFGVSGQQMQYVPYSDSVTSPANGSTQRIEIYIE